MSQARDSLLAEMRLALFAEFGALALYGYLARFERDVELAELLTRFRIEEEEQIVRLRALIESLGGRPPMTRWRRRMAAWMLALGGRVGGGRLALRLCLESEETVSRWYARFAVHLARTGLADEARTCDDLAVTKRRHALALRAWVER